MIEVDDTQAGVRAELKLRSAVHLPCSCEIDFGPHLVGTGWHSCEQAETTRYRWMGEKEYATLMLAVDRSVELEVAVKVYMVIDEVCWSSFGFVLDGQQVFVNINKDHRTCRLIFPVRAQPARATELKICNTTSKIVLPDPRRLSIAISRVSIRPKQDALPMPLRLEFKASLASYIEQLGDLAPVQRRPNSA